MSRSKVDQAGAYFDGVVARIQARDFAVRRAPERKVCAECDFRMVLPEGLIHA